MFSMNLITIDSYQSAPSPEVDFIFSDFRGSDIRNVPVVRIFGTTFSGKKTCLHVHGVFPYIYVPCTVEKDVDSYMYRLAAAIDSALNVSFGSAMSTNQHVYKIQKVSGIPMYGYHEKEHLYFKIFLYNPALIKRTADLLQNGVVLNQNFQPHEAHIPFILQFMIDYNLYGMSLINLSSVKYRQHANQQEGSRESSQGDKSNPIEYLPARIGRQSLCELEIDAHASNILNREEIASGLDLNPGIAAIWNDERARREAKGLQQAEPELLYSKNRDSMTYFQTDNDIYQEGRLVQRLELISQVDESMTSVSSNTISYPLEVQDENDTLSASHVLGHQDSFTLQNTSEKNLLPCGNLEELDESKMNENVQMHEKSIDASLLDADDMNLVDLLAGLAEENTVEKGIDNDSVLGSQYSELSNQMKDENEEEEIENLNLTSLELESVTSWDAESCSQPDKSEVDVNNENRISNLSKIEECEENLKLPQYDGTHDLTVPFHKEDLILSFVDLLSGLATNSIHKDECIRAIRKKRRNKIVRLRENLYRSLRKYFLNSIKIDVKFLSKGNIFVNTYVKNKREFKRTRRSDVKSLQRAKSSYLNYNRNIFCMQEVDHKDLDVYDLDVVVAEPSKAWKPDGQQATNFNLDRRKKESTVSYSSFLIFQKRMVRIPALDGDTQNSSSDSEVDQDVTIARDEQRICVYKSATKTKRQSNVVDVTPRKRIRDLENEDFQSPTKRRNVGSEADEEPSTSRSRRNTPIKSQTPRSPRILSGLYSPLDITIISPTANRDGKREGLENQDRPNGTSMCTTPRRRNHPLRISLLREQSRRLSPITATGRKENAGQESAQGEFQESDNVKGNDTPGKSVKSKKKTYSLESTGNTETLLNKGRKEVRKKLSFVTIDERESSNPPSPIDAHTPGNLDLAENINDSAEHDPLDVSPKDGVNTADCKDICKKNNEPELNIEKDSINLCFEDSLNQTVMINLERASDSENDEDVCNMTFTQYLNEKLKTASQHSIISAQSSDDLRHRTVSIAPRYNPPTRQRIIDSLQTYGISAHKSIGPFFSNKADLLKQKESSNKNANIYDVPAFKSSLDRVTGIKIWRRVKVNEFHPSGSSIKSSNMKRTLAGYTSLAIQPLVQPPSPKDVKNWLRAKRYLLKKDLKMKKLELRDSGKMEMKTSEINESSTSCENPMKDEELLNRTSIRVETLDQDGKILEKNVEDKSLINETSSASAVDIHMKKRSQESNSSLHSNASSDNSMNPSLRMALENSLLHKNNETQQHLGISYGQLEFSTKGQCVNAADENYQNARAVAVYQYLTLLSLEVHVATREDLLPDPEKDSIEAIFYAIHNDVPKAISAEELEHGAIIISSDAKSIRLNNIYSCSAMCRVSYAANESELFNSLITLMRECDPDILLGWEIETLSWGYIFQRASRIGLKNFTWQISRVPSAAPTSAVQSLDKDDIKVPGRIVLDVWRIMRHETALMNYTFENIMYHVMHERIPCPNFRTLTDWWRNSNMAIRLRVIAHYVTRVLGTLRILLQLDIIGRSCEHARLIGIQFYEVFSRGSQFRVESMMLRLAKPLNYIPISPSVQQRAKMRAPESLPLIMEPQSIFYTDPLIVLDFQSLYPSIIIAYNYCFSTCIGRIEHIGQYEPFEFGAATLRVKKSTALKLRDKLNFAPCGVAYVKKHVRQGILPRMLTEILNTRLMVKESMKLHGSENVLLQRVLDSQQLGLKLIANVTYGYTAANFSGRMPCIEIGDSVVSKGRETLERAIKIVESTERWGAQVVYGDTDSLFVLLPGKSREEAFSIGAEIADVVTAANPPPVKLKFEKVLHPCILQTKKRYCGYMYENPGQEKPEYLAKGIETVRRDGCPAVAKILEKSLKILFDTKDVSLVKQYVVRQFDKILRGKISIQDLTFAREFRGLRGYKASACVPALELTRRLMRKDPRAVPRTGERVRYVVVAGAPNQALIHCIRTPMEVMLDEGLTPNAVYYITKVIIPPLNRCLNLIGTDVNNWYREMSHRQTPDKAISLLNDNQKSTIRQFFSTVICAACGEQTKKELCASCVSRPSQTIVILYEKIRWVERAHHGLTSMCQSCTGYLDDPKCESLDCPILYRLAQARRDLVRIPYLSSILDSDNPNTVTYKAK